MTPTNNTTVTAHTLSTSLVVLGMAILQTIWPKLSIAPQVAGAAILIVNAAVTSFIPHPADKVTPASAKEPTP